MPPQPAAAAVGNTSRWLRNTAVLLCNRIPPSLGDKLPKLFSDERKNQIAASLGRTGSCWQGICASHATA